MTNKNKLMEYIMNSFIEKLADAIEKEASEIQADHKFREFEEWDSFVVLSVIAMIKQNFGITIPRKEFDTLLTVEELYKYINSHSG